MKTQRCESFLEVTKMASSTITIELSEQDRRRIDALVEALKTSEELSKRIAQVEAWIDRRESYESEQREYGPE